MLVLVCFLYRFEVANLLLFLGYVCNDYFEALFVLVCFLLFLDEMCCLGLWMSNSRPDSNRQSIVDYQSPVTVVYLIY